MLVKNNQPAHLELSQVILLKAGIWWHDFLPIFHFSQVFFLLPILHLPEFHLTDLTPPLYNLLHAVS